MRLRDAQNVGDGRLAWFAVPGASPDVELYLEGDEARVCYYPGWDELDEQQRKDIVGKMMTQLALRARDS